MVVDFDKRVNNDKEASNFHRRVVLPMDVNWADFNRLSEHPVFGVKVAWKHVLCRDATCNPLTIWNDADPPPQHAEEPGEGRRARRGRARRAA